VYLIAVISLIKTTGLTSGMNDLRTKLEVAGYLLLVRVRESRKMDGMPAPVRRYFRPTKMAFAGAKDHREYESEEHYA
jgi:hypothetical protein